MPGWSFRSSIMIRCDKCYPDNDGGLWCDKHRSGITDQDCMRCMSRERRRECRKINIMTFQLSKNPLYSLERQ